MNDVEIDAIEQYIDNSEAPPGVTLTNMYSSRLNERVHQNIGVLYVTVMDSDALQMYWQLAERAQITR